MKRTLTFVAALVVLYAAVSPAAAWADQSGKLDESLQRIAGTNGTSRVIVRFNDERNAERILTVLGGRHMRDLHGTHVLELPNRVLARLASLPSVSVISEDRIASGSMFRVTGTIESDYVNTRMKYTGRNVGVAIIDSGLALHDDLDKR